MMPQGTVLTGRGDVARPRIDLDPPKRGEFFGWVTDQGPCSVALDDIAMIGPDKNNSRVYIVVLKQPNISVPLSLRDALDLMRRLGWTDRPKSKSLQ